MIKTFTVNGQIYKAHDFDYNTMCDLEEMGVGFDEGLANKSSALVRAYFAICAGISKAEAGKQIAQHIVSGGSMDAVVDAMVSAMNESDFFRKLKTQSEETEPDTEEVQPKKAAKSK